jgi:hypothetical protein
VCDGCDGGGWGETAVQGLGWASYLPTLAMQGSERAVGVGLTIEVIAWVRMTLFQ